MSGLPRHFDCMPMSSKANFTESSIKTVNMQPYAYRDAAARRHNIPGGPYRPVEPRPSPFLPNANPESPRCLGTNAPLPSAARCKEMERSGIVTLIKYRPNLALLSAAKRLKMHMATISE